MTTYDNIRNRRIELNLSQEELAKKLGYSDRSAISKIEAGHYVLTKRYEKWKLVKNYITLEKN